MRLRKISVLRIIQADLRGDSIQRDLLLGLRVDGKRGQSCEDKAVICIGGIVIGDQFIARGGGDGRLLIVPCHVVDQTGDYAASGG